jgi:hypothetical protein
LRPVAVDKIDVEDVQDVTTGEILGANQWNTFDPSDPASVESPGDTNSYQLEDGSIVRIPASRPGRPSFQRPPYRRPYNGRPTDPTLTEDGARVTGLDPAGPNPTKETFFDGSFVGQPTPEIINGDVRDPPRPPTTQSGQTYDPFQEYEDSFPGANIEVSSDGYSGFNDVGNDDFGEQAEGNNGQYKDNADGDGNAGYPGVGTASSGGSGNRRRRPRPPRVRYNSSEYVNEVRYPHRPGYEETGEDGERSEGGGNFLKIPVVKSDKNKDIFAPTRETPLVPGTEGDESGRKSDDNGEIDLSSFLHSVIGEPKSKNKRKFETSSTTSTFSTKGEPTFINIDNTVLAIPDTEGENTGKGSVIITTPTKGAEPSSVSQINPVRSTDFHQTTSAVSLHHNEHESNRSVNVFKFPQRPKPQPSLGAPNFNDNISDNEVIHNNRGAAIVEQV